MGYIDWRGSENAIPGEFFRYDHYQLDAPNFTPTVALGTPAAWVGPVNKGTFAFCYTYVRGYKDIFKTTKNLFNISLMVGKKNPAPMLKLFQGLFFLSPLIPDFQIVPYLLIKVFKRLVFCL